MADRVWQRSHDIECRKIGEQLLVFHGGTGDTHILFKGAADIIEHLAEAALSETELIKRLRARSFGHSGEQAPMNHIILRDLLETLQKASLAQEKR